jgi:hypothetical protein
MSRLNVRGDIKPRWPSLGDTADEILAAIFAVGETGRLPAMDLRRHGDPSGWLPLSDALEESGQPALAGLARRCGENGDHASFFDRLMVWLGREGFDAATMEVVIPTPPYSVDRRWISWRSIEVKPHTWKRVAFAIKGACR